MFAEILNWFMSASIGTIAAMGTIVEWLLLGLIMFYGGVQKLRKKHQRWKMRQDCIDYLEHWNEKGGL
ncbi:hypothetical protein [Halorussus halophilus]|uniref:hypothetical protein n=1 Tax=Halorussus halophilus TaxID=2650975 RepID=UPI001300F2BD|nr:hypothetical protein [Halorussus halophilus]